MSANIRFRTTIIVSVILAIAVLTLTAASPYENLSKKNGCYKVTAIESLGLVTFPTGTMFADTEVGGLSGITYDAARGVYYALSDARSEARYYTVVIDLSDGSLDDSDVTFLDVTYLLDENGDPFEAGSLDPEGIELVRPGLLYISSEGDADASPPIDPFVNRFNPVGKQTRALPVPDKFLPDGLETFGIRDNLAFESLTSTPDRKYLYTATENALVQDGPPSTLVDFSPSRFLEYHLGTKRPGREFVYMVNPIPKDSDPPGIFADNGLVDIQALDNCGTFLAMERSFAVGVGNTVVLYETSTKGATDVSGITALDPVVGPPPSYTPMEKRFIADFETDLGVVPDNLEALAFGPTLPDGRMLLIAVSDNNFNPSQITQFIALAVNLK
jgi:3-phytase/alkaline phosphatase D